MLINLCDCSVLADTDAFAATDAVGSVFDFDVPVSEDVNLAENMFWARIEAIPAGYAVMRVSGDVSLLPTVAEFVEYSHSFLFKITSICTRWEYSIQGNGWTIQGIRRELNG